MLELTGETFPLKGIKKVASRRMVEAWQAPVFHLSVDVDMQHALVRGKQGAGTTVTDIILLATRDALLDQPQMNAHFIEEAITVYKEINIGLAVATDAGLMVPVIHNVHAKSLQGIAENRKEIVAKSRSGSLGMADIDGATFTISNLGMLGIDRFDAIINPPQIGILAIGSTKNVPIVKDSGFAIAAQATFTLTCDHRAVDGATGAKFLTKIKERIELPIGVPTE
jgi:pyruvate dehydrogenase E2 component (dihydrolipoamide acetyltransferase)